MICTAFSLALAAACMTPANAAPSPTRLGQWTRIEGLRVRPDRVVEDSRCPMNARCIQAGRAVVRVTIRDGRRARQINVTLGEAVPVRGGTLALISVTPEKMAGAQPKRPAPYRFTFELRR